MAQICFTDWDLDEEIQKGISALGWEIPTPIQIEAIPVARKGGDLIGQARTGSGKTGAFGIPILESVNPTGELQSLILCPTRELANQVAEEMLQIQGGKGISIATVYGGTDIEKQAKMLDKGVDIIVGTPGRVMDMTKRGHINLEIPTILALDEADRMLDMGFMPDILWVLEKMTSRSRTLLFSATFPPEILDAANQFMNDAEFVQIGDMEIDLPPVDLYNISIGRGNKLWALGRLLTIQEQNDGQTIVFTNTKRMVDLIVERLRKCRIDATGLHGDLAQAKREKVLNSFKEGDFATVIATDVAARGLDVEGVTMVVNYDVPNDVDSFIHRIGRTGRAGRRGEAWSFISRDDSPLMSKVQGTYDLVIPQVETPELPDGVSRDPVKWREDFGELSDVFGMVPVKLNVGTANGLSKLSLHNTVLGAVKMDEMAIGEIYLNENDATICIHKTKVSYVVDGLNGMDINGKAVSASTQ